ncbi:MAG: FecR family protein [Rhizomicrobium sp.]
MPSDIDEQAIAWLVRLTSGETVAEDHAAFARWRALSRDHEAALARARQLWVGLGNAWVEPVQAPPLRRTAMHAYFATAACLVLAVALIFQYRQDWRHDYVTAAGQRESFTLADGSRVELDGGSALDVRFADGARKVVLARGEAFFDVVHDPRRPFTVIAGAGVIRDVGTAFGVRLEDQERVTVTVARGSVEVNDGVAGARLVPDRRLAYGPEGLGAVERIKADEALAWTRGRLMLEDLPLTTVLAELDRHTDQRIVFLGSPKSGLRHVSAAIDLDHTADWLDALRSSQNLRVVRLPGLVVVY